MAILNEMTMWVITYSVIIIGGLLLFNFMSNGFLLAFIKTKMKRGKQVLVVIHGKLDSYPSKGWVEGKRFFFYDRETKKKERNKIAKFIDFAEGKPNPIVRLFGVPVVMIDEVSGRFVYHKSGELGGGFDAIQQEQFIIRALQRPMDSKIGLLILLLLGVAVLALIAAGFGFMAYNTAKANSAQLASISQYLSFQLNSTMQQVAGVV